jgi:hypothetical protein
MAGYPWSFDAPLTSSDLNAALGLAINTANAASISALNATSLAAGATATVAALQTQMGAMAITLNWPAGLSVTAGTYVLTGAAPYGFTATSVTASIGSAGGSITANFRNAGLSMGNLGTLVVTAAAKTTTPASGNNLTVSPNATVDVLVTITGTPADAFLTLNGTRT